MKISSIKNYLRSSTIKSRKSTVASAFASALAPHDSYDQETVADAMRDLDQDPDSELECVYCGAEAATWDHVFNRVVKGNFSGHGHRIRNLVPCCRTCNESKGQKPWRDFLDTRNPPDKEVRVRRMERFLGNTDAQPIDIEDMKQKAPEDFALFIEIRERVYQLMAEADELAANIRQKVMN